jgi:hypothetical protein
VRVSSRFGAQDAGHVVRHARPIVEEVSGAVVEEHVPDVVRRAGRPVEDLRVHGAGQRVGREVVPPPVADERHAAGERVEDALDAGTDLAAGRREAGCRLGPGEVEEVQALGIVEAQCARDCVEHAVGRSVDVAALELGVVVGAHAGEVRDLLATQSRHPSYIAVEHVQPGLPGRQPRPARHQELTDLVPAVHAPEPSSGRRRACGAEALRGARSTPFHVMDGSTVDAMTETWLITGAGRGMGAECRLAQTNDFESRS